MTEPLETPESAPAEVAPQTSSFERTISPIAGRLDGGKRGKALVVAGLVAGCGIFVAAGWRADKPKAGPRPDEPARQVVAFEPLKSAPPTLEAPGPGAPQLTSKDGPIVPALEPTGSAPMLSGDQRRAEAAAIRGAPLIAYRRSNSTTDAIATLGEAASSLEEVAKGATELDDLRRGSAIGRAKATRLPDRNFLIVAGAAIPCVLQTAMDTATPGYVSCVVPREIMSDNGAVVLLEKGTKVLGEYRSTLKQGQRRLFVLWTRAVTPAGVAISLASPAADPVGRAGFDGDLDTHFWSRFGGALLLSIVDDAAIAASSPNGAAGTTRLPSDAAGIALQNSVNIPPSLRKMQGSEVSIFVAQDFDFSGVYGLKAR